MLAIFFWSWILKDCIKVQEKKKKVVVLCTRPRQNVKLGTREIKSRVYGERQTSNSSEEFLRIENEQIKTVQDNSYG